LEYHNSFDDMHTGRRDTLKSTIFAAFGPPWPWPLIGSQGTTSCSTHWPLPTYKNFVQSRKTFVDGQTDRQMEGHRDWLY